MYVYREYKYNLVIKASSGDNEITPRLVEKLGMVLPSLFEGSYLTETRAVTVPGKSIRPS